jgi:hypothetical protein
MIWVQSPTEVKCFSSNLCVHTGLGAHPASCPMGTEGPLAGLKRGWGVTLIPHPHLVPSSRMIWRYIFSPHWRLHGGNGATLLLPLYYTFQWKCFVVITALYFLLFLTGNFFVFNTNERKVWSDETVILKVIRCRRATIYLLVLFGEIGCFELK